MGAPALPWCQRAGASSICPGSPPGSPSTCPAPGSGSSEHSKVPLWGLLEGTAGQGPRPTPGQLEDKRAFRDETLEPSFSRHVQRSPARWAAGERRRSQAQAAAMGKGPEGERTSGFRKI